MRDTDSELFADLTALSLPGESSSLSAAAMRAKDVAPHTHTKENSGNARDTVSAMELEGTLESCESASSMQCSADPAAFAGFHSRFDTQRYASRGEQQDVASIAIQQQQQLRLALDLGASGNALDARSESISVSQLSQDASYSQEQFTELFCGDDTQGDAAAAEGDSTPQPRPTFVTRGDASTNFLLTVETEWHARNENEPNARGIAAATVPAESAAAMAAGAKSLTREPSTSAASARSSDVTLECDDDDLADVTADVTTRDAPTHLSNAGIMVIDDDDDDDDKYGTNGHAVFTNWSRPRAADSSSPLLVRDETDVAEELERLEAVQWFSAGDTGDSNDAALLSTRRDSIDSIPDTQSLGDDNDDDDDVDQDVDMVPPGDTSSSEDTELALLHDGDAADEESPNHPSALSDLSARTMSPVQDDQGKVAQSPARVALKKRVRISAHALSTTDSPVQPNSSDGSTCTRDAPCSSAACAQCARVAATKLPSASRSLAMSFSMPDSQDSASQSHESASDVAICVDDSRASTASSRLPRVHAWPAKALNTSNHSSTVSTTLLALPSLRLKRAAAAAEAPPSHESCALTGTSSTESTPTRRKRARSAPSPDVGASFVSPLSGSTTDTSNRRNTRTSNGGNSKALDAATAGTPLSGVRTRARGTPPVPAQRSVSARARTMLKHRFEFCVTGFVDASEAYIVGMIQDHGGRLVERPSEMLFRGNAKAVVIATPVSWRKLKFLHAVACGIPVVHPEWLRACIKAARVVPFDGFFVPSGYSVLTRKFECLRVQPLNIFAGVRVGIAYDVREASVRSARGLGAITAFILKTCGAACIIEDLTPSKKNQVDVVLSDEMTKTCEYYRRKHRVPVKSFSWVTECMVLQRFLSPRTARFEPQALDDEYQLAANAVIGDADRTMLKLHPGELVLVDLSKKDIDSFLIFHVCEILRISIDDRDIVMLEVGVLKRGPNPPMLTREHTEVRWIPASHVKKRVVAVAETDFKALEYRDETMFCYEDTGDQVLVGNDSESSDHSEDDDSEDDSGGANSDGA